MNGLETGLYSLLILVALTFYTTIPRHKASLSHWTILGAILGLMVLARVDAVFLIFGFIFVELWRARTRALLPLLVMGIASILVSSPWWIFNYLNFGSIMPQSGQSEAIGVLLATNLFNGSVALADILSAFFYFPYSGYPEWLHWVWIIAILALILFVVIKLQLVRTIRSRYDLRTLMPLVIASFGFLIFYLGFFAAWWFLYRYFHPIGILWIMIFAIGIEAMLGTLPNLKPMPRRFLRVSASLIVLSALIFNVNRLIASFTTDDIYPGYLIGKWANEHPNVRIGMEQSGTAGFLAPNVFNLDGKINPEALAARRAHNIGGYIAKAKFDYLADWELIVNVLVDNAKSAGAIYVRDSTIRTMVRYKRLPQ
jgi:4-amino-4-deoxy-L-arabinose transferase-like glycosyltransferase